MKQPDHNTSCGALRVLCGILLSLASCLNYPARIDFGQSGSASEATAQTGAESSRLQTQFDPADTLISSQLVMELSHPQMEALDPEGNYTKLRRYPVRVYRIAYRSRNFRPLSALLLLPVGTDIEEYSVLAYHHGALLPIPHNRMGAYEAPSFFGSRYRKTKDFFAVNKYGLPAASSGYLTVLVDYMGYGIQAGAEHPFMIGPELGQESMDAVRASYQWARQQGLRLNDRLYLAGTSEGAYAALWSQRFIEEAPDLVDLKVEGAYYAGPYHTSSLLRKIALDEEKIVPLFNWALYATWDYYLRSGERRLKNLARYFEPQEYRQIAKSRKSWTKEDIWQRKVPNLLAILLQKPLPKEELFQNDFLREINDPASDFWVLADLLNIHEGWQPKGPIQLYHNQEDPLIPLSNSQDAQRELSAAGGRVELKTFERSDHAGSNLPYLFSFLAAFSRSSGLYAPSAGAAQPAEFAEQ